MSRTPGGRIGGWTAPGAAAARFWRTAQIHPSAHGTDASLYGESIDGLGSSGCICVSTVSAATARSSQQSIVKVSLGPNQIKALYAISERTRLAPSTIAFIFPNAASRGKYLRPQSGATIMFSGRTN